MKRDNISLGQKFNGMIIKGTIPQCYPYIARRKYKLRELKRKEVFITFYLGQELWKLLLFSFVADKPLNNLD